MDPGRAPLRIFLAHPLNEITQAAINPRPPCPLPGIPAPESFEARAMRTRLRRPSRINRRHHDLALVAQHLQRHVVSMPAQH